MNKRNTTVVLLSALFILSSAFAWFYYNENLKHRPTLPVLGNPGHVTGAFQFTNQDGKLVTNNDVEDKVRIVEYFYTTCEGICPKMNDNMVDVYDAFKGNNHVIILSHTVDPEIDSVPVMKAYSQKYGADPQYWSFLTGDKKELYDMARYSYLVSAEDPNPGVSIKDDFIHSEKFVLVDPQNRIRGQYDGTKSEEVQKAIQDANDLLDEYDLK